MRTLQTRDLVQPLVICAGKELNSRLGVYRHADLVGVPYGSKVGSRNGKGFIHVLRPTPELWTLALPHRTQILYLADIAFVTSWLDIKPGSRVIEAGECPRPARCAPTDFLVSERRGVAWNAGKQCNLCADAGLCPLHRLPFPLAPVRTRA